MSLVSVSEKDILEKKERRVIMYSSPVPPRVIQPRQDLYGSDRDLTFSAHQQEKRNVGKTFQYNGRVAAVILPCLGIFVGYGGPVVAGVLIVRDGCLVMFFLVDVLPNPNWAGLE